MVTTSGYRRDWLRPARRPVVDRAAVGQVDGARRPRALSVGAALFVLATLPFLMLAAAALEPTQRWLDVLGQWPNLTADQHGYRLLGGALAVLALGYLVFAVRAGLGSASGRTGVTVLTAVYDATLFLVLLADPRAGWLFLGAGVLVVSLAAVVLCFQPEVDRYLAERAARRT